MIVDNKETRFQCTNYTFQDLNKPAGEQQQPAPVVEVPGEPGVMAVRIPVPGWRIEEVEDLDEYTIEDVQTFYTSVENIPISKPDIDSTPEKKK